jgi:prepilin-type N-terminal cleavage/methylation domain-containing protein
MLNRLQNRKEEGFTIIEVLIVLAIAGLIMLIVFLAVPALQRNSRNNARNSDASRVVAAVTECLANRNGQTASCDTWAEFNPGTTTQITALGAPGLTAGQLTFGAAAGGCQPDGTATGPGAGARSFSFVYQLESGGANIPRCIAG